jgi:NAD(P)-dependent dehydrogenase (short-subunit alcohol dehydrogenase family)
MTKRLQDRVALITGASRGIGAAVAEAYAREGAKLVLVSRDVEGLEQTDDRVRAAGGEATLVPLDLGKIDMIDQLAVNIAQKFGRLDILVGNAGSLGTLTPLQDIKPREFMEVMTVNLTANWRLLRAFHGGLLASPAGRVIFTTSGITKSNTAYWGSYAISKSALESMAQVYAHETATTKIRVNVIDPGAVRTNMRAEAFPGEDPSTLPTPESIVEEFIRAGMSDFVESGQRLRVKAA